jgi:hypothetical protein
MIAAKGGFGAIIEASRAHCTDAGMQHICWDTLFKFASQDGTDLGSSAKEGIEAITAAMNLHKHDDYLQLSCCRLLDSLCVNNVGNVLKVVKAGGVESIVAALTTHPMELFIRKAGCRILGSLCNQHNEHATKILVASGLGEIFRLYLDHNTCQFVFDFVRNNDRHASFVAANGGIPRLVANNAVSRASVVCPALLFIMNLSNCRAVPKGDRGIIPTLFCLSIDSGAERHLYSQIVFRILMDRCNAEAISSSPEDRAELRFLGSEDYSPITGSRCMSLLTALSPDWKWNPGMAPL